MAVDQSATLLGSRIILGGVLLLALVGGVVVAFVPAETARLVLRGVGVITLWQLVTSALVALAQGNLGFPPIWRLHLAAGVVVVAINAIAYSL